MGFPILGFQLPDYELNKHFFFVPSIGYFVTAMEMQNCVNSVGMTPLNSKYKNKSMLLEVR